MKRRLLLPMTLLIVLTLVTSCQSVPDTPEIDVPAFGLEKPSAPTLVEIPDDTSGAITALTVNLSRMDAYIEQLEMFITFQERYYRNVLEILGGGNATSPQEQSL